METSRSPAFTSEPSAKWMDCTAPATRERRSTRSTASRRPEKSSQVATSVWTTVATITAVAGGGPAGADAWEGRIAIAPAISAVTAIAETTATAIRSRAGRVLEGICWDSCYLYSDRYTTSCEL